MLGEICQQTSGGAFVTLLSVLLTTLLVQRKTPLFPDWNSGVNG